MRVCTICFILLFVAARGGAEEKAAPTPPIEKLLQQLRSDDFEEREKAQRLLSEAGEPARIALEAALRGKAEADFSHRVKLILEKIDAENHLRRFDTVRRVDLQLKGTLREALDQLKADFKCNIVTEGETLAQNQVNVSLKNASFFEALEAIRVSGKAGYMNHNAPNTFPLGLVELKEKATCPTVAAGQFLFVLQSVGTEVERTQNFGEEKPNVEQKVNLTGTLAAAPGVRVSAIGLHEATITDAANEKWFCNGNVSFNFQELSTGASSFGVNVILNHKKALRGPLAVKFTVLAVVPAKLAEKETELAAKSDTVIELNGSKVTLKPAQSKDRRAWEIPFTANTPSQMLFHRTEQRSIKVKKKEKEPDDEEDEETISETINPAEDALCSAGVFIIDTAGARRTPHLNITQSDDSSCSGKFCLDTEPKTVLTRSIVEKVERLIPIELKEIPLP